MVIIKFFEHGKIDPQFKNQISDVINNVLDSIENNVIFLEVHLFSTLAELTAYYTKEVSEIGVQTSDIFFAMHDAWRGYPRISICLELLKDLPKSVWIGGIIHELGHAILHGSIEYYVFSPPSELTSLTRKYDLNIEYIYRILYLLSIAIKDYEVTNLFINTKFEESQYPFIKHILQVSDEEIQSWRLSWSRYMRILHLLTIYKTLACAKPMLNTKYRNDINKLINSAINYLPPKYQKMILSLLNQLEKLHGNISQKLNMLCSASINRLIKPILKEKI